MHVHVLSQKEKNKIRTKPSLTLFLENQKKELEQLQDLLGYNHLMAGPPKIPHPV
jgi:hypothetical protein